MTTVLLTAPYMLPSVERFRPVFAHYGITLIAPEVHERMEEDELLPFAGQVDGGLERRGQEEGGRSRGDQVTEGAAARGRVGYKVKVWAGAGYRRCRDRRGRGRRQPRTVHGRE